MDKDVVELSKLVTEQAIDDNLNRVKNPDDFAKFVFSEIEKRGKMDLNTLMKELDLVIGKYKKGEKVE